jgi:hypothetical protein
MTQEPTDSQKKSRALDPSEDPHAQSNAPIGGGRNRDPGPAPWLVGGSNESVLVGAEGIEPPTTSL